MDLDILFHFPPAAGPAHQVSPCRRVQLGKELSHRVGSDMCICRYLFNIYIQNKQGNLNTICDHNIFETLGLNIK